MVRSVILLLSLFSIGVFAIANPTRGEHHLISETDPTLNVSGSVDFTRYYEIEFKIAGSDGVMSFVPDWVFQFGSDTEFQGSTQWPLHNNLRISMISYETDVADSIFTCEGVFNSNSVKSSSSCTVIFSNSDMSLSDKMYVDNDPLKNSRTTSIVFTATDATAAGIVTGTLTLDRAVFFSWLGDSFSADRLVIIGMTAALIVVLILSFVTSCFAYACSTVEGPFKLSVAYPMCFFLGFTGIQRFYLGQPHVGKVYLCTLGIFGLGWLFDLLFLSRLVTQSNLLALLMASEIQSGQYALSDNRSRGSTRGSSMASSRGSLPPSSSSQFLRRDKPESSESRKHVHIQDEESVGELECVTDDMSDETRKEHKKRSGSKSSSHRSRHHRPTTSVAFKKAKKNLRGKEALNKEDRKQKLKEAKGRKAEFRQKQKEKKKKAKEEKKLLKEALKKNDIILDEKMPEMKPIEERGNPDQDLETICVEEVSSDVV